MATIQGVYVALFGRPADPTGLAYFNSVTQNGANLNGIGDLASTQEYKDRFGTSNNTQIVTAIYQSLFNRDPEAAGLNFFVDALNKGTLNVKNIAIAILDGAQGTDKTTVDAKIASANVFTAALDTPTEIASYAGTAAANSGRAFLADVTTTVKTSAQADAAVKTIVDTSNVGTTNLALTGGTDDLNSTTATGTLLSTAKNDTITAASGAWVAADKIDGGFGVDTFNATVNASVAPLAGNVKNVEIFNLTADDGVVATNTLTVDFTNVAGATQVWNASSVDALSVTNIALGTAIGLKGTIAAASSFGFAGATGTADAATLVADAAGVTGGVTVSAIENLTISNSNTSTLGTVNAADATSVTLAGSGSLSLALNAANATTVTNNSTGTVTVDLTAANKLATYTGGAAIDAVTVDHVGLTANQTINLGGGADTAVVKGGGQSDFSLTLNGGAGSDLYFLGQGVALNNVKAFDTAANLAKSLVVIADFNKAEDSITFDNGTANTRGTLTVGELGQISGQADLLAAVNKAVSFKEAGEDTLIFSFGGDAYIYTDNGAGGLSAGDALVKISGIAAADLTASNFTFV